MAGGEIFVLYILDRRRRFFEKKSKRKFRHNSLCLNVHVIDCVDFLSEYFSLEL
jgi:hypothetical protein